MMHISKAYEEVTKDACANLQAIEDILSMKQQRDVADMFCDIFGVFTFKKRPF
jgi:hypothetical protein